MKLKLLLLLLLAAVWPAASSMAASVVGVVVNGSNGSPLSGATVTLRDAGLNTLTNFNGQFRLDVDGGTTDYLTVTLDGYDPLGMELHLTGATNNLGEIRLQPNLSGEDYYGDANDLLFDESVMEEEEGSAQGVSALTGANDNIYYNTASYNFGPMYFRYRGLDSQYQSVYLNGIRMNDLVRGSFTFNNLLGMTSRAFRNKTTTVGLDASTYGFGDIAGSVNYNTTTDLYAPGFNGSAAFTNSNYMFRAMGTYSSGLNKKGWAFTVSAIGRYAKEGVVDGTFYNSAGLFASIEKVFDAKNSLTLTAFGGPTQRATGSAVVQEAYDLAGSNLYNPNWGYYDGKKRSSRITETFDPTVMLNWLFKDDKTTVNTAVGFRSMYYNRTALQYFKATDPNPAYYRYLPSYFEDRDDPEAAELYTYLWKNDEAFRQLKWDDMYYINELNNIQNQTLSDAEKKGSSYIMENRINHQLNFMANSYVNTRLSSILSLQGGVSLNYTKSSNYKTIRDLMGGEFWLDIDPFSDRVMSLDPQQLQNDLDNPNRRVGKGDTFGYDYNIRAWQASAWLQNMISLPHWEINYALEMSYTQFQRDGHMRNGRAPLNSYGKGATHRFDNAGIKLGATYKLDGRNFFQAHASYKSRAPLFEYSYISPRIKDDVIDGLQSERVLSVDASYVWLYRRFRGSITGFYTEMRDQTERTSFYDDQYQTFMNYVLKGVNTAYKGIELGASFKITPSITASVAGTIASYRYKNRPTGVRSYENGMMPDTATTVYLKNYHIGGTPQTAVNVGIDWAAPHSWFFGVNASYMADAYVNLTPVRHEALSDLWTLYPDEATLREKIDEITTQEKLNDAFTLNASIGKIVRINRKVSMNVNLNVDNILNKRNIMTYGYQQGRFDYTNFDSSKYPNKYYYTQGIKVFLNVGVRF